MSRGSPTQLCNKCPGHGAAPSGPRLVPGPGLPALGAAPGPFAVAVSGSVLGLVVPARRFWPRARWERAVLYEKGVPWGRLYLPRFSPVAVKVFVQASVPACSEQLVC